MTRQRWHLPLGRTDAVLVVWFTVMSAWRIIGPAIKGPVDFGWDAVAYARAARALLDGGDPWAAGIPHGTYAAPPTSLLPFLPFAYVPEWIVQVVWVALAALSALFICRRLGLPLWWFLFPPLLLALVAGSSALPLAALLVRGGVAEDAAAIAGRVYSAVPLAILGRWKGLVGGAVVMLATAPLLEWDRYIREFPVISSTLAAQSGGGNSAYAVPLLIPVAVMGLLLVGRRKAAWLAVPALWPNAQEYYAVIALPVAAEVPIATIAMATPLTPGIIAVGIFMQGAWDRWNARKGALRAAAQA
jgi:hypothetical protein